MQILMYDANDLKDVNANALKDVNANDFKDANANVNLIMQMVLKMQMQMSILWIKCFLRYKCKFLCFYANDLRKCKCKFLSYNAKCS